MVEVLSPAGDRESFYTAINSGADAIYMGAPKFNARMKASNFSLDDMREVVRYAHLKGVKIYVTLNTLVTSSELKEVVSIVGDLWAMGIDAFIVQDFGIVYVLKGVYPDIVLHGSTQMAVHNWRGAKVAKEMGLSRVVLSREVNLDDIAEIREKVDIELEVFVQGALCVAFSGNCYMSSIKCMASGNRGECKQLCRLPYTATIKGKAKSGYLLSPRDISNIDYIYDLITLGVVSFKIEGRLRRSGYVGKTTEVYRDVVDAFYEARDIDVSGHKATLKKVFSRGEFIPGYIDGNDIIETSINNHIGQRVGIVKSSVKFKDIYKITIALDAGKTINSGDGIKFKVKDDYISMGVGNVEYNGNNVVVYGKNYIHNDSIVYLTVDSKFEENIPDKSKKRDIHLSISAMQGNKFEVKATSGNHTKMFYGDILAPAKTRAVTEENIITQFSKVDKNIWNIIFDEIVLDDVFMPLSALNEIRREIIECFESIYYTVMDMTRYTISMPHIEEIESVYSTMAIISDKAQIGKIKSEFERIIFAPTIYSIGAVEGFLKEYKKYYDNKPILKLPIIAMADDLKVIDSIVDKFRDDIAIMIENIYGLDYISTGIEVIAGTNMNIANDYSATHLRRMGVNEMVSSIEKWCPTIKGTYKVSKGRLVLMTLAHCPYKTIAGSTCDKCTFSGDIALEGAGHNFTLRRYRVARCYYELVDNVVSESRGSNIIVDLR